MGNLGVIGFSGAYSLIETKPLLREACAWAAAQYKTGMSVTVLAGHWDVPGLGASSQMAVPEVYDEAKKIEGCDAFESRGMLKFIMGHTHCNVPHPHGRIDTGFMVAGMGMEGCGNYGVPIVDTTAGLFRMWYFEVQSKTSPDNYEAITACVKAAGAWRPCVQHAKLWVNQTIPR